MSMKRGSRGASDEALSRPAQQIYGWQKCQDGFAVAERFLLDYPTLPTTLLHRSSDSSKNASVKGSP